MLKSRTFYYLFLLSLLIIISGNNVNAKTLRCEKWKMVEICLNSTKTYQKPFEEVHVDAIFEGPDGKVIKRPAFWDGGNSWKIRFAPNKTGVWRMTTYCNIIDDSGLHHVKCKIRCRRYRGRQDVYKHGFIKVSNNGRYFIYDDGTPFFYLGDTHWLFIHERFNKSNIAGVESQFKYCVDKRVKQGYTVYQSEAIQRPHSNGHTGADEEIYCHFENGLGEDDLPGLQNIDRKFKYIADKGLLHANSQICWVGDPSQYRNKYTKEYMYQLGRYWSARYGAYPVLWTVAQEIDKNVYGNLSEQDTELWKSMAKGLTENDDYHHPLSAHMENVEYTNAVKSAWKDKEYHRWWAVQWKGAMTNYEQAKSFWDSTPTKPAILYESGYENLSATDTVALRQGFIAFQSGMFGYGYGANGVWNDIYEANDFGAGYGAKEKYIQWFAGMNLNGGGMSSRLKRFYEKIDWWMLEPRFKDEQWLSVKDMNHVTIASIDNTLYLCYFWGDTLETGTLKNLKTGENYEAKWYYPLRDEYVKIRDYHINGTELRIPDRTVREDVMFILKQY